MNECDPAIIAMFLFRRHFESSPERKFNKRYRAYGFRFDHKPPFQVYLSAERDPRIAYYAIFLAFYVALYWKVRRDLAKGCFDITHHIGSVDALITKFLLRSSERVAGGVIFRPIPGFPIPQFLDSTIEAVKTSMSPDAGFQISPGNFG